MLNGAEALLRTLVGAGVTTCFTNPGTSEIHFVAAVDSVPEMQAVLTLFEGVATGAADGYARMADVPAATLLHLGPGLGNGLANLHNARRARVPVLNIIGDHATYHTRYDPPLQSDIATIARNVSGWVRTSKRTEDLVGDALEAVGAATGPPCQVATLIVPADISWQEGARPGAPPEPPATPTASDDVIEAVAKTLRTGRPTAILLGGRALRERGLAAAAKIAAATGAKLLAEGFPARLERGAGIPAVDRFAYWPEFESPQLDGLAHLVLADATVPVSLFAYPGKDSFLLPSGCAVHSLSPPTADVVTSLEALVEALGATSAKPALQPRSAPEPPAGPLTVENISRAVGSVLPEGAIVSDETMTSGMFLPATTAGAPRHDWLTLTGGAIGQGLPVAVGAAVACPDRPVIALQADGSALYTIQSLWTMAREQLNVTVVIFNNRSYKILEGALTRADASKPGPKAKALLDLGSPDIDFVALGTGLGIESRRVETAGELSRVLSQAVADPGPHLIEALIPRTAPAARSS